MSDKSVSKQLEEVQASLDLVSKKLNESKTLWQEYSHKIQNEVGEQTFKWLLAVPGLFALALPFLLGTVSTWEIFDPSTLFVFFMIVYGTLPLVMLALAGANSNNAPGTANTEPTGVRNGSLICACIVSFALFGAALVTCRTTDGGSWATVLLSAAIFLWVTRKTIRSGALARVIWSLRRGPTYRSIPLLGLTLLGLGAGISNLLPLPSPGPKYLGETFREFKMVESLKAYADSIHELRRSEILEVALASQPQHRGECNFVNVKTLDTLIGLSAPIRIESPQNAKWSNTPLLTPQYAIRRAMQPCIGPDSGRQRLESLLLLDASLNSAVLLRHRLVNEKVAHVMIRQQWIGRISIGIALALVGGAWLLISDLRRTGAQIDSVGDFHAFLSLAFCILFLFAAPLLQKQKSENIDVHDAFGVFTLKSWFVPTGLADLTRGESGERNADALRRDRAYGGSPHLLDSLMATRLKELETAIETLTTTTRTIDSNTKTIFGRVRPRNDGTGNQND